MRRYLMMGDKIVRCTFSTIIESRFVNLYNKSSARPLAPATG